MNERCSQCRKRVWTETQARKAALSVRVGIRRLSAIRGGYHQMRAFECPHGNGWHIGRPRRRVA